MATDFRFPDVGEGIHEGTIVKWHVKEGDVVKKDQVLLEIETDKAVVQIPSPESGKVLKLWGRQGQSMTVGDILATIGSEGEQVLQAAQQGPSVRESLQRLAPQPLAPKIPQERRSVSVVGELEEAPEEDESKPSVVPARPAVQSVSPLKTEAGHLMAAPATRKLAKEMGVDLHKVAGTGPKGLITPVDVARAAKEAGSAVQVGAKTQAEAPVTPVTPTTMEGVEVKGPQMAFDKYGRVIRVPMSTMRKAIASKMTESKQHAPHAVAMLEVDITRLEELRQKEKAAAEEKGLKLTMLPFVIKAVATALKEHPYVNASLDEEKQEIVLKNYYHVGFAVDTPAGLMVPVIRNVDSKSVFDVAHDVFVYSENSKARAIDLEQLRGGTFTVTNYGSVGRSWFGVPVINYPEAAILGMGRAEDRAVVREGKVVVRKLLPLSLSFDHRVVDGALATEFMNTLAKYLEDPDLFFVKMT